MSITNIISNDEVTLVQGVNGVFLCEESWTTQSRKSALHKEDLNTPDIESLQSDLPELQPFILSNK